MVRLCGCQTNLQSSQAIGRSDGGFTVLDDIFEKIEQLVDISFFKTLIKSGHGIMRYGVIFHDLDGSFPKVTAAKASRGAENLGLNIVSVESTSGKIDGAQIAIFKIHIHDGVIRVSKVFHFSIRQVSADGLDTLNFPHQPTGEIEIVNAHVDEQSPAMFWIEEF
mgnify:CR=1 FL=1